MRVDAQVPLAERPLGPVRRHESAAGPRLQSTEGSVLLETTRGRQTQAERAGAVMITMCVSTGG